MTVMAQPNSLNLIPVNRQFQLDRIQNLHVEKLSETGSGYQEKISDRDCRGMSFLMIDYVYKGDFCERLENRKRQ